MKQQADVIILGAGVVGLSAARRLAARGATVVVLDLATPGGQGSRAAAGVAIPSLRLLNDPAMLHFVSAAKTALEADLATLPYVGGTLRRGVGIMRVLTSAQARAQLEAAVVGEIGLLGRWLDPDEAVALEPVLAGTQIEGAFLNDEGYLIDTESYITALLHDTGARGVTVRLGEGAVLVRETERGVEVQIPHGMLNGDRLVVAAGAWSGAIPGLPPLPIRPLRGQMMTLMHPRLSVSRIICNERGGYLAPWRAGEIVVGATEEEAGFANHTTPSGMVYLSLTVNRTAPALRDARVVRTWSGLRAASVDGRIMLGAYPSLHHTVIAAGHGSQGILTGALSGHAVDEIIATGHSEVAAAFVPRPPAALDPTDLPAARPEPA